MRLGARFAPKTNYPRSQQENAHATLVEDYIQRPLEISDPKWKQEQQQTDAKCDPDRPFLAKDAIEKRGLLFHEGYFLVNSIGEVAG